jgi:hypothetical protein
MWILAAFIGLWLFYCKKYHAFKFEFIEKRGNPSLVNFSSYFGQMNFNASDFGFIIRSATWADSRRSKRIANLLLLLFYVDLILLTFIRS